MCSVKCFWISSFLIFIAALIIGITFWIIGAKLPQYFHSGVFTSVPVYKTTYDGYDSYGIVNPKEGINVYPVSKITNTSVFLEILYSNFVSPEKSQTVYLLHNFWGFSINISIIGGDNRTYLNKILEQNFFTDENIFFPNSKLTPKRRHHHFWTSDNVEILLDDLVPSHIFTLNKVVPSTMLIQNNIFVRCPSKTLLTTLEGADPSCSKFVYGELMELQQPFQIIEIGDIVFHDIFPPIYLVFHNSQGFPMNFVDIPMILFASWKKSNSKLFQIIGIASTFISIFLMILFGSILFRASPNDSAMEEN